MSKLEIEIAGLSIEVYPSIIIIVSVIGMAMLSALGTRPNTVWYQALRKPEWQPAPRIFAIVWPILYGLFALSAIIVWSSTTGNLRGTTMLLFVLSAVLTISWSFIFYEARSPFIAALDLTGLWISIVWIMLRIWPISTVASLMLVPFFLWVGFAAILNWTIMGMNE